MKKVNWKSLKVKLIAGEVLIEEDITLDKGERIVSAIATNREPEQLVSLGLYENGTEISAPMNIAFWKRSNSGHFLDGFKPIEFKGGSQITARVISQTVMAEDLDMEIVFGIIKEDTEC